jgi:hypothetical protein
VNSGDVDENFPGSMEQKGVAMREEDPLKGLPEVELISFSLAFTGRSRR